VKNKFKLQSKTREDNIECWWIITENNVSSDLFYNETDALRYLKRCNSIEKEFKIEDYFYPPTMKKPCFRIVFEESFTSKLISWVEKMGGEDHNKDELKYFSSFSLYGRYFRVLPSMNMIQMGDSDFYRWANSVEATSKIPLTENDFISCMAEFKTKLDNNVDKDSLINSILEDLNNVDYIILHELFSSLTIERMDYNKDRAIYDIEELLRDLPINDVKKFKILIKNTKEMYSTN